MGTEFLYTDQHREEYYGAGLTVLRGVIPASLLTDLRREAEKARELARTLQGPQTQRLQPVYKYPELHHQPFHDFHALPGMRAAVENILGPEHAPSQILGILFEPQNEPWCTHWHRDWGYNVPGMDIPAFFRAIRDPQLFNQLNGALYDDHCLWVVPGSHNSDDLPEETAHFPHIPPPGPELADAATPEERERRCLGYTRAMPGATPVPLFAGDVAFYRACGWHIGNYVPYTRRATLHDGYYCPEDLRWQEAVKNKTVGETF
ncbi:phytanoyl-CoA dioxygenase family protein [Armatimonas sp.]|uniref:phytanoyl-CoA dioxygenase family protein n=1 Tax=Armatimonas sp. TaxID=1872638 RepID=UPI00286CDA0C|nr:phytanoyl-CoA dioxygenase family protein [Armatimonas sp.]